ncbi:hypothetical protein TrVE_jg3092 [Triparma verrucosa]|uniref:Uncharacterized protein n=1 Tax=Triparma verrucosa TaxID=1606542 RepID=A0A9W7B8U9_9STRA|nr:hypothetical protein TrVE_jg3092 [Triparma verrucosa]
MNDLMSSLATTPGSPNPLSPKTETQTSSASSQSRTLLNTKAKHEQINMSNMERGSIEFDALFRSPPQAVTCPVVPDPYADPNSLVTCPVVPDPVTDPNSLDLELVGPVKSSERCRNGPKCTYAGYFNGCKYDHGPLCRNGANCTFDGFFGGCKFYHGPYGRHIDRQKQAFAYPGIEEMGEEQRGMLRIVEEKLRLVEEKFRKVEREKANLEMLRDTILSTKEGDVVPPVETGGESFWTEAGYFAS